MKWFILLVWNAFLRLYNSLSGSNTTKLISFSLAGLLFPALIPTIFKGLVTFSLGFLTNLTGALIENSSDVFRSCQYLGENEGISGCFFATVTKVFSSFLDSFSRAYELSNITFFPIGKLIIFVAVTLFLSESISRFSAESDPSNQRRSWIEAIVSKPFAVSNIVFFGILGVSLYLSIASIAAIPSLQSSEAAPDEVSVDQLEQRLNDSANQFRRRFATTGEEFNQELNPLVQIATDENNPLLELQEYVRTVDVNQNFAELFIDQNLIQEKELPKEKHQEFNAMVKELFSPVYEDSQNFLSSAEGQRSRILDIAELVLLETKQEVEESMRTAITEYEFSNIDRKGSRETVEHFSDITNWFDSLVDRREEYLTDCFSAIQALDSHYRFYASNFVNGSYNLNSAQNIASDALDNINNPNIYSSRRPYNPVVRSSELESTARDKCQLSRTYRSASLPERPDLGDNLGPFKFVARWLLNTESLPLALITGLLGFGLLGSACSSFVRERINKGESSSEEAQSLNNAGLHVQKPLVTDLSKVTVIGLSAAILAFLSVVGGLSIFSVGTSAPNPYALLLACLIASVFGEDIWDWARYELHKKRNQSISPERDEVD